MNRQRILTLVAGLIVLICGIGIGTGIWKSGAGAGNSAAMPQHHTPANPGRQIRDSSRAPQLFQPRLNESALRQLNADPEMACRNNPSNLDLLAAWAARDPEAAETWVNAGGNRTWVREYLLGAIAAGVLIRDGVDAMNRFNGSHQSEASANPEDNHEFTYYAFFNLGRQDTIDTAVQLLHDPAYADFAGILVMGVRSARNQTRTIEYLEAQGIRVGINPFAVPRSSWEDLDYWADWAARRNPDFLAKIVQYWVRDHPSEAKAWVDQHLPAADPQRAQIDALFN